jgi:hypothetical protein
MPIPKITPPFRDWTKSQIDAALYSTTTEINLTRARAYIGGDHWQGGDAWIGPMPRPGTDGYAQARAAIAKGFVSRNVIGEVVDRHKQGVVGHEPIWGFTPREGLREGETPDAAEQALVDEAEALITEWWDDKQCHEMIQNAAQTLLWSKRAMLRLYVPKAFLREEVRPGGRIVKVLEVSDIREALSVIFPEHLPPEGSAMAVDEDSRLKVGLMVTTRKRDGQRVYELSYQDGTDTIVRVIDGGSDIEYRYSLTGHLTMYEMTRELLVTEQMYQGQNALNLCLTMSPRVVTTAGFLERALLNVQLPGHFKRDADGNETDEFVPGPHEVGAGTTNAYVGVTTMDQDGNQSVATPDVKWREPSDTKPIIQAKRAHYQDILEEADQAHILIAGDAEASGKAREQARADYDNSLRLTAPQVEAAIRWMLDTVLAWAEALAGKGGTYTTKLKATAQCRIDTGPITPEERNTNTTLVKEGMLSKTTAMSRNGVLDPDAEITRIAAQEDFALTLTARRITIVKDAVAAQVPLEAAMQIAGLDMKYLAIVRTVLENNAVNPADDPSAAPPQTKPALVPA